MIKTGNFQTPVTFQKMITAKLSFWAQDNNIFQKNSVQNA